MSKEEESLFQQSNSCWICKKLIDNDAEKVIDHYHVTPKLRGAAHGTCNINLQLTRKVPVIFHTLRGYDSFELDIFDVDISVIPNRFKKYMALKNLLIVFVDSIQFMNSSLDKLVKNLSDKDFKYLVEGFGPENLEPL